MGKEKGLKIQTAGQMSWLKKLQVALAVVNIIVDVAVVMLCRDL